MEDDDNKSKPKKDDPLSSQVLEYYKSFSQSRQLPKYFSGTETNNVTPDKPKVHTCILQTSPTCITSIEQTKISPKSVNVPIPVVVVQEVKDNVSPSSSITSPKKLEWDSGADIGYENYQKHKFVQRSVSLPILTNLDQVKLAKSYLRITPDIESNLSKEDSKKIVPSKYTSSSSSSGELDNKHSNIISSSSSSEPKEKSPITTTSSSDPREVPISSTTTSTESENYRQNLPKKNLLDSVKKHVGYPVAESTPLQIERKYTSKLKIDVQGENSKNMPNKSTKSTQFEQETPINKKVKKSSQHKKKLMKTTPITIDCVNYQKLCDKLVQTSFPRNLSISVQTDPVFSQQEQVAVPEQKSMSIGQKVIYLTHSNSEKDSYISSCNSFEYLSGEQHGSLRNRVLTHLNSLSNSGSDKGNDEFEIQPTLKDNKPKNIQCDSPQSNITESDKNSILSNTSPVLGELIANQQSSLLISDIEHSISLLQKLVKSKKYDKQTKKYYIKKIVDKILNCKYADDSLSDRNNTENSSTKNVHSPLSEAHEENIEENYIDKNIGWTSPSSNEAQPNNLNGNFKIETFTSEFMPCESGDIQERKVIPALRQTKSEKPIGSENNTNKRSQFTLTKGSQKIQQSTSERNTVATANKQSSGIPSENFIVSSNNNSPEVSSAKSTYDNSYKTSARSWKDDKTISEKLYEQGNLDKIIGDHENNSDVLLNFAKKERETQINWINNEITHLSKLKKLLEQKNGDKTDKVQKVIDNILYAPELDSLKDVKKSTAVYVITTERGEKIDSSSTDRSNATKDKVNFHLYNALNKEHGYQFKETVAKTSKEQDKIVKSQVYVDIKKGGSANIKLNAKKIPMDGAMGEPPNRSSPDSNDDIPKVPALNLRPRKLEPKPIKDPKLITSQSYCIRENPQTCIRRYVFEIPINEENCDCESHIQGSKLHSITKPEKPCKKDSGKGETNASRKTSADSWNRRVMLVVAEKQGSEEKVSVSEIFEQNIVPMSLTQPFSDTDSQNVDEDGTPWRNESVNSIGEEEGFLGKHDLRYRDGDDDDATKDERRTRRGGRKDEIYPDDSARTDYEGVRMEREDERFIQESEIQEYDGNYPTDDRRQIDRDGRRSPHDALDDRRRVDRGGRRDQRYDDEQDLPSIDGRQNRDYPSSDRRRTGRDYPSTDGRQDFDDRDYTSSDRRGTDRDFPSSDGRKDFDDREYPSTNTRRTDRDFPSSDRRNADKGGRKGDHSYEDRQDDRGGRRDQKYANEDTDNRRSQQPDRSRGSYQRGSADQKRYKNGKYPVPKRLVKHGRMTSVREEEENRKHIKKQIGGGPNRSYVEKLDNRGKTRRGSGSPQGRIRPVTKVDVVNKRQSKDGRDFDGKVRGKYRDRSPDNKIKFGSGRRGQPTAKGERHSDGGRKYNTSPQDGAPKSPGSPKKSSLSKTDDKQGRKYSASKGDKTRDSSSEYGVEEEEQKSKSDSSKSEDKTTSTSVENKRGMQTKTAQTENKQDTSSSSSSSSSSSTSSTSSSSYEICRCCRRRELVQPEISIPNSTLNSFERNYFCPPCNNYYGNRGICYRPGTACNCYSMIRNDHINDIKQTVNQLQQLYQEDLQCICSKGKKPCTCRRKPKRKKKGIAYMLTLEETTEGEATKKSPKKNLEEFTIKIPVPKHKHKSKDKDKEKHSHKSKKHDKKNEKKHKKHHRSLQA